MAIASCTVGVTKHRHEYVGLEASNEGESMTKTTTMDENVDDDDGEFPRRFCRMFRHMSSLTHPSLTTPVAS